MPENAPDRFLQAVFIQPLQRRHEKIIDDQQSVEHHPEDADHHKTGFSKIVVWDMKHKHTDRNGSSD